MADPIYLDHNATTPVARQAADAMWPWLTQRHGNPSSTTPQGRLARAAVERAREQVATLLGARPDEVVLTSGGTEANNLAVRGAARAAATRVLVTSPVEHPATTAPVNHLREEHDWQVHELPVDATARVLLEEWPAGAVGLGTLILAHNEVGTVQPVAAFAEEVHARGGVVHADAAQAVGKVAVDVEDLGVDLLSVAGHKLYGPQGVGALYVRRGVSVAPVLRGAGQERGLRPGTENVAGIVGLGVAAEVAGALLESEGARQAGLRDRLWQRLRGALPDLVRITPEEGALPNTLLVAVPGRLGDDVLALASGVAASTGSACHAGTHTPSAALRAAGYADDVALGALRLTLGRSTTQAGVDAAADAIVRAVLAGGTT